MNAQENWRNEYRWLAIYNTTGFIGLYNNTRDGMKKLRREAALERICARQQREIEAKAKEIEKLKKKAWLDDYWSELVSHD